MDMELVAALLKILRPFQCTPGSMLFTASETGEQVMFVITKVRGSGRVWVCWRVGCARHLTRLKQTLNKTKLELNLP